MKLRATALTTAQEEVCPLSTTFCFLFLKKMDNRFKRLQDMPFFEINTIVRAKSRKFGQHTELYPQSNALHNFHKRGQQPIARHIKSLDLDLIVPYFLRSLKYV